MPALLSDLQDFRANPLNLARKWLAVLLSLPFHISFGKAHQRKVAKFFKVLRG